MIDSNISMEEDTELRDLVVQTLDSNGTLAKVRAELRASIFLSLEEHESVLSPEPLLNKKVKQCLENSEGKLLFSLVREFLEYFGLEYTAAVFDPETCSGKDYTYEGREKLCRDLGLNTKEPLLGEILKNTINSALDNSQKNQVKDTAEPNPAVNETFVLSKDSESSISNSLEKLDVAENEKNERLLQNNIQHESDNDNQNSLSDNENMPNGGGEVTEKKNIFQNQDLHNLKNKSASNTLFFNEIIIDGKKEKFTVPQENLPPISTFVKPHDLPALNGTRGNVNDLKELMDIAQGIHTYDDDFNDSSASGSGNEQQQSPTKELTKEDTNSVNSIHSDNISENIDEEILSSNSCLENISIANLDDNTDKS